MAGEKADLSFRIPAERYFQEQQPNKIKNYHRFNLLILGLARN